MDSAALTLWAPRMLAVLRIVTALIFIEHGLQKQFGFPASANGMYPAAGSLPWLASFIEIIGGLMVLFGFYLRPAALLMSGTMAVAYWTAHAPRSFFPVNNGGDAAILYCFVFLYFVFAGGGAWTVNGAKRA